MDGPERVAVSSAKDRPVGLLILGNINLDLILGPLDDWPTRGTEALVAQQQWRVGGNAGNAVIAAQALGVDFMSFSTIGHDFAGEWLKAQLGSQVNWTASDESTSVSVAVTHADGERTFISHLGHLQTLCVQQLSPLPASRYALLAGAFLTPALRREYPALLAHFAKQQTRVALDMGWPDEGFTEALRNEVAQWLPQAHYLLINEIEACGLSGCSTAQVALLSLAGRLPPDGTVVIKRGGQGVLVYQQNESHVIAAPQVNVIDSVGAGDTWNTAFLSELLQGSTVTKACTQATLVASRVISTSPRIYTV